MPDLVPVRGSTVRFNLKREDPIECDRYEHSYWDAFEATVKENVEIGIVSSVDMGTGTATVIVDDPNGTFFTITLPFDRLRP